MLDLWGCGRQKSTLAALTKINPMEAYDPQASGQSQAFVQISYLWRLSSSLCILLYDVDL